MTILGLAATSGAQLGNAASLWAALLFALVTGLGMLAGVWVIRRFEAWAIRHTAELIAFAAGLLVSGALLHLVPSSVDLLGSSAALTWTLVAFLAFYLLEAHFVPHVHARGEVPIEERHSGRHRQLAPLVVIGLGFHSVVDGVSVGAGLSAGALLGSVAALLVVVHKMPVGIAVMSTLYHSGVPGRRAAGITSLLALVTPAAVVLSYLTFRSVPGHILGVLLGLAAGSFLYVGGADLLPEGQARGRPINTLMFGLGTALMMGVKIVAG